MRPLEIMTQKEALERSLDLVRGLIKSTNNQGAKGDLDSVKTLLERVSLMYLKGDGIPEYDQILLMEVTNRKVSIGG